VPAEPARATPGTSDPDEQLRRIRQRCAAIRRRLPQASWDLAVIETTAATALDRGCRPADADAICRRLLELTNCMAAMSEDLHGIGNSAAQL
jgi:hypothetical protein